MALRRYYFKRWRRSPGSAQGRYILTYTCDLPEYQPIQKMFRANGFELIGTYPNYYYEGEARLAFYKPLLNDK